MMAKGLPTFSARQLAEAQRALLVEAEADDGLVVLVETGLRVGQVGAIDGGAARGLHPKYLLGLLLQRQGLAFLRRILVCAGGLFLAEQLEGQLGGAADDILHLIGILHAGQLDGDAVLALLLDGRFDGAQGIDAVLDDLQGLADGERDLGIEARL